MFVHRIQIRPRPDSRRRIFSSHPLILFIRTFGSRRRVPLAGTTAHYKSPLILSRSLLMMNVGEAHLLGVSIHYALPAKVTPEVGLGWGL